MNARDAVEGGGVDIVVANAAPVLGCLLIERERPLLIASGESGFRLPLEADGGLDVALRHDAARCRHERHEYHRVTIIISRGGESNTYS